MRADMLRRTGCWDLFPSMFEIAYLCVGLGTCTGLRVMPRAAQPNLLAMCRLLPPMPQPTSTICGAIGLNSVCQEVSIKNSKNSEC